jgi:hypothetical protein
VVVYALRDRVVVQRFDLMEELQKGGGNYLFVRSMPVPRAQRGFLFTYHLDVCSKSGGVKYRLVSGPKRMDVNPNAGVVLWTVPADLEDERIEVTIGVSDRSKQEVLHQFELYLTD